MNQLGRALRMTLKYRWSLVGSFVCSLLVAILWGANLGAVYPFVEIVLQNKTLPQWVDERVADSTERIEKCGGRLEELSHPSSENVSVESNPAAGRAGNSEASADARQLRYELTNEQNRLAWSQYWQPIIHRYMPDTAFRTLAWLMAFMVVGTVLRCFFLMGSMVLVARAGHRTVLDLQQDAFGNALNLETHETQTKGTSDLISRIRTETTMIGQTVETLFGKTIREPLKMAACLAGAAYVNWRLLLLSVLVCPLAGLIMTKLAKATKRSVRRAVEQSANLLDRLYQALSYQRVVKAFAMEDAERQRFKTVAQDIYRKRMRIAWFGSLSRINNELLGVCMITLSVLAGGYLALTQETHLFGVRMCDHPLDFGSVMAFFGFLVGVADPIRKLGDVYQMVQHGVVAANRVFPLIDGQPEVADAANPQAIPAGPVTLEMNEVCFEYQPNTPILQGVTLNFPAGSSTAIVGHNGCGKSTLINLLPRFFDPCAIESQEGAATAAGAISINGVDLRHCRLSELRQKIGYVTQQTMLFNDTIANNIGYGSLQATQDQIIDAAKQAHAFDFIEALSNGANTGFDTVLDQQTVKLSGGQRQRISLARAILKDAPVLILDEATSQIDPESETLIHETLKRFIRGRTTIMITHRLSTLDLVDQIVIMNAGRVVDCGSHEQLLARCVEYQRMRSGYLQEAA